MKKNVYIDGMCCDKCAKRAENAISACRNVVNCDVKFKKNMAVVRSREPVSDDEIREAVERAGFTVTGIEEVASRF
ncbi:MAG: heavy-metal-associated domain-containing protein [Clostridia bacterium]|nr:heavy-metal-associated domain-containing protein [Clostridia bacterium]